MEDKTTIRLQRLAAFLIPIVLMTCILIAKGCFPFGDQTPLRMDMYHQYAPFMKEFFDKLRNGDSLLFSWNIGGGMNFVGLFAYYLASPLNWLAFLVPRAFVLEFMAIMIVGKTGLASLIFSEYLSRHTGERSWMTVFFGIFYSMSGYMAAYSWNLMWLDCIVLLPLILYGLECMVKKGSFALYTISLGLCILSNYYISIMICIFLVFYFLMLLVITEEKSDGFLVQCGRFAGCSLIAGGLSAVLLIPEAFALTATASASSTFPKTLTSYFTMFEMISRHLFLVESETGLDHWPNVYCGVAVLALVPLYVLNRRYSYKEKIAYFLLLLFFYASFSLNMLNYIWHGMHFPNSLPARQSFLYITFVLIMSYKGFLGIPERSLKQVIACFSGAIGFMVLAEQLVDAEHFSWYVFYLSILFTGAYGLLAYLYRRKIGALSSLLIAVLCVGSIEAALNMGITALTTVNRVDYKSQEISAAKLLGDVDEEGFYRVEHADRRTKNDGAWLDYPSASTFSSTCSAAMSSYYKSIGLESSTNAYCTNGATPLSYAMLSVRYLLSPSELSGPVTKVGYEPGEKDLFLYRLNDSLPIGYVLSPEELSAYNPKLATPIDVQNSFSGAIVGRDILHKITLNTNGKSASIDPAVSAPIFAYITTNGIDQVSANHGTWSDSFSNVKRGFLLDLGMCKKGESVSLSTTDDGKTLSGQAAWFDSAVLHELCEELGTRGLQVTEMTGRSLTGTLTSDGGTLVTSIPYDKGWKMKVDGVTVIPEKFADTFISFTIAGGTHTIELSYMPPYLPAGALVSAVSLALLLVILFVSRYSKKDIMEEASDEDSENDSAETDSAENAPAELPADAPAAVTDTANPVADRMAGRGGISQEGDQI